MMSSPAQRSRFGLALIAAISFATTVLLLPASFTRVGRIDDLLATLAARAAPYEVVHIGSSRVYRQISPEIFDRRLAKRGHRIHSFNAGVGGMRIVESSALLERIVANPKTRPAWVVFEASGFFERIEPENLSSPRTLYWHDLDATLLAARSTQLAALGRFERFQQAAWHFQAGAFHTLNLGTWSSHVAARLGTPKTNSGPKPVATRGFAVIPSDAAKWSPAQARRRKMFLNKRDGYDGRIAHYPREVEVAQPLTGFVPDALRAAKETAARHGVELVFLLAPQSIGAPRVAATIEHEGLGPLLDFANPIAYPKLFIRHHRFDREHLNERGSTLFSAYLAEAFAALIDERQSVP